MVGRIVLVTGAASGIGLSCARRFAAEGATVVATDVDASTTTGCRPLDVADPGRWATVAEAIAAAHGGLDIVHLNAGVRLGAGDVTARDVDDSVRLIGINQHGVLFGLRAPVPLLEAAGVSVMDAEEVAEGVMAVLAAGTTGQMFVQLPGEAPMPFDFPPVPSR